MSIPAADRGVAAGGAGAAEGEPRPGLAYLRIPKTASTSVAVLVRNALQEEAHRVGQARGFRQAHATWGRYGEDLTRRDEWVPIATFRDPLERVFSYYRYLQRSSRRLDLPEQVKLACLETAARPLSELIRDESSTFFISTMPVQTFYLGTGLPVNRLGRPMMASLPGPGFTRQALVLALERLEHLAWIGLVETLDRDLETLAASQGWPPFAPARLNAAPPEPVPDDPSADLDHAARRMLQDRLAADCLLVEAAREIAAERHRMVVAGDPAEAGWAARAGR
ncbi:MAG: hypothetical protein ACKOWF_16580 [Chloroflexota bacterium]